MREMQLYVWPYVSGNFNQYVDVGKLLNMHHIESLRYNYNHCVYLFQV